MAVSSTRSPRSADTPISEPIAKAALAIERYVLPWSYVWFAYTQITAVIIACREYPALVHHPLSQAAWGLFWAGLVRSILLSCLSSFMALTLFFSRRPKHLPQSMAHIIVPLAMSYYFLLYPSVNYLPEELRESFIPPTWRFPASMIALSLGAIGYAIALWGILYLRRSFALFVAVREVVSGGPYAWVRHPMYLGYLFEVAGLLFTSPCLGTLLLAAGFLLLTLARAQLEEQRLVAACPEYREYMRRTGFLLPRFRRGGSAKLAG